MTTDKFHPETLNLIEMLGLISDYLDPGNVERQFFRLIGELFSFDRIALFFVKHEKGMLQCNLAQGFDCLETEELEIPLDELPLTRLLADGLPYRSTAAVQQEYLGGLGGLGLQNFALIPIVKRKSTPCWELKECTDTACPSHGKSWLRCWHFSGDECHCHISSPREEPGGCPACPVYSSFEAMEGLLLVDNSLSGNPFRKEVISALFAISQMVAVAIGNSKRFQKTLAAAIRDELTGLYNRRYFNERFLDEIERSGRYGGAVSLISCDIDNFKEVNDRYGHQAGDLVLAWLGGILRERLRKSDVIARFGGEEFMILLLNTPKDRARETAEYLRRHIAEAVITRGGAGIKITASFGVASLGEDGDSVDTLFHKADKALYAAKLSGRNRVQVA